MNRSSLLLLACSFVAPAFAGPKVEVIAAEVRPTGGAASAAAIDVFAVFMGLPWLIGADPVAFALYLGTAGGTIALRRFLVARAAPAPAPAADVKHFEYDR